MKKSGQRKIQCTTTRITCFSKVVPSALLMQWELGYERRCDDNNVWKCFHCSYSRDRYKFPLGSVHILSAHCVRQCKRTINPLQTDTSKHKIVWFGRMGIKKGYFSIIGKKLDEFCCFRRRRKIACPQILNVWPP